MLFDFFRGCVAGFLLIVFPHAHKTTPFGARTQIFIPSNPPASKLSDSCVPRVLVSTDPQNLLWPPLRRELLRKFPAVHEAYVAPESGLRCRILP